MKMKFMPFAVLTLLVLTQCKSGKQADAASNVDKVAESAPPPPPPPPPPPVKFDFTFEPVAKSVEFENMDPDVDPRFDFYEFANGKWIRNNPVPSTESSWGSFNVLTENNNRTLRKICEDAARQKNEKGSINQLIGDYYYTITDSVKRQKDGITPIANEIKLIDGFKDKKNLASILAHQHKYGIGSFFSFASEQDLKDNSAIVIYTGQGGTTLPSKDYYTKKDSGSQVIRDRFVSYIEKMLVHIKYKPEEAKKAAKIIYEIEESLADASMSPLEMRDFEAQYNKMGMDEFKKKNPSFNWDVYIKELGCPSLSQIIVSQPLYIDRFEKLIAERPLSDIRHYLKYQLIHATAGKLTPEIEADQFAFTGTTLRGAKKMKPGWQRALNVMSWSAVGEAMGHAFVDKTFSPEAKVKINEMVDNIFAVFKDRLDTLEWMSTETRKQALTKLASFTRKLGYPDKWTDYSALTITRNSYVQNSFACSEFLLKKNLEKVGKPIDKGEWSMAPHIVNAYYNPLWNEIVFPAGIMQPPFFDVTKEDAVNYARMGAVIGHELTHGFDDQGAQFDATGNLTGWWTEKDLTDFKSRTQMLINCFNEYEAMPGLNVNGELTIGENIADLGGLKIAYYAYQRSLVNKKKEKINGFTPEQRFFISYAQVWKTNYTESALKNQVYTNPHAPGKFRVLGPLSNMYEFFDAFYVQPGDKMRKPEDKMAKIW